MPEASRLRACRRRSGQTQTPLLLLGELQNLAHRLHHGHLRRSVVLLLHERYEVLRDHSTVNEELPLSLLLLGLSQQLACLVTDRLVLSFEGQEALLVLFCAELLGLVLVLEVMEALQVVLVQFDLLL